MQRRNIQATSASEDPLTPEKDKQTPPSSAVAPPASTSRTLSRSKSHDGRETSPGGFCSTPVLLLIAILLSIATYMVPGNSFEELEKEAMFAEKEMMEWWQNQGQRQPPDANHPDANHDVSYTDTGRSSEEATKRMLAQSSRWVDGEKKLKQKLKQLAELQSKGKELGAPVLTRYLGEDIPAWAGEGVDVDDWNQKVKAAYDEMREEEEQWKKDLWATLQNKAHG